MELTGHGFLRPHKGAGPCGRELQLHTLCVYTCGCAPSDLPGPSSDSGPQASPGCRRQTAPGPWQRASGRETLSFPKGWPRQPTLPNPSILLILFGSAKKEVTQRSTCLSPHLHANQPSQPVGRGLFML